MVPLSVLDLSPIVLGGDARTALRNTLDLAQHCERWGYRRYWLAEHHNMPGVASAATSVAIAHVAGGTSRIRVGAGGIMLPNHAPYVIAEQFGTLEALFPGRIDLGVGRAPGSDQLAQRALRTHPSAAGGFGDDVLELQAWFRTPAPDQAIRAVPGAGADVPIWILGSSLYGAQLAAELGLPFAFASHFAPAQLMEAIALYRKRWKPTGALQQPYVMLGVGVVAAETDAEARHLATSLRQAFANLRRGRPGPMPPPDDAFEQQLAPAERAMLDAALACAVVGSAETVHRGLAAFAERTSADELMITGQIFDHAARLRSFEITAELIGKSSAVR
jgi:luciferase family oxidoreductase group 1